MAEPRPANPLKSSCVMLSGIRFVDAHFCFNGFAQREFGFSEVVHLLKIEPEFGLLSKNRAKRRAVSGVIARLPRTISPIRVDGTRMLIASRF